MQGIVTVVAANLQRLRQLKKLSQKQVALAVGIPQGQYSRIENAKVEPTLTTLAKIAGALDISLAELMRDQPGPEHLPDLPLLEKLHLLDQLDPDERQALIKIIDLAISKKQLKDNLAQLAEQ